jgi:hypothetical protein
MAPYSLHSALLLTRAQREKKKRKIDRRKRKIKRKNGTERERDYCTLGNRVQFHLQLVMNTLSPIRYEYIISS